MSVFVKTPFVRGGQLLEIKIPRIVYESLTSGTSLIFRAIRA